jgi:amidase
MGLQAYQSVQLFSRNDLRLAASVDLGVATIAREVSDVFDLAIDRISRMGFVVEAQHPDFTGVQQAFETLRAALLFHEFGPMIEDASSDVSATVRWNVERGRNVSLKDVLQAETIRTRLYRNCAVFFEGFDFLLLPSASVAPWPLSQADVDSIDDKPTNNIIDYLTITYAISLVGLPVMSIPCGWTPDGRPIGMQIVAGPGRNGDLLAFAALLEQDDGFRHRFPA